MRGGHVFDPGQPCRGTPGADLEKWRNRPLGEYVYLFVDAYYEQVREDGQVRNLAVLTAVGVNLDGKREILGVSVSLSEHEVHWRAFLESLKARGLGGVQLITSDAHEGLKAARLAVFGGFPGSDASSTCSKMPRPMCLTSTCKPKSPRISAPSSMPRTAPPQKLTWPRLCRSTRRPLPAWPNGWQRTSRKD